MQVQWIFFPYTVCRVSCIRLTGSCNNGLGDFRGSFSHCLGVTKCLAFLNEADAHRTQTLKVLCTGALSFFIHSEFVDPAWISPRESAGWWKNWDQDALVTKSHPLNLRWPTDGLKCLSLAGFRRIRLSLAPPNWPIQSWAEERVVTLS